MTGGSEREDNEWAGQVGQLRNGCRFNIVAVAG